MADRSDGSIVIDTKIDNSGFEKGSKELTGAVNSLTAQVSKSISSIAAATQTLIGQFSAISASLSKQNVDMSKPKEEVSSVADTAENSAKRVDNAVESINEAVDRTREAAKETAAGTDSGFKWDFGKPKQQANTFANALKGINAQIDQLGEDGKAAIRGDDDALTRFRADSKDVLAQLETMRGELDKFGNTEFETNEHKNLSSGYQKAAARVKEFEAALEDAEDAQDELMNGFEGSGEVTALKNRIKELKQYQAEYNRALATGNTAGQAHAVVNSGVGKGTIADALEQAESELDDLRSKFADSTPYRKSEEQIDKITESIAKAKEEAAGYQQALSDSQMSYSGYETDNYEKSRAALDAVIDRYTEYRNLVREGVDDPSESRFANALDIVGQKLLYIGNLPSTVFPAIQQGAATAGSAILDSIEHPIQAANYAMYTMQNAMNTVSSGIANAAGTVGNAILNGIQHPVQTANDALYAMQNAAGTVNSVIAGGLKTVGPVALGIVREIGGGLLSGLKAIGSSALSAAGKLATMVGSGVLSGLKAMGSAALSVAKNLAMIPANAVIGGIKKIGSAAQSAASNLAQMAKNAASSAFGKLKSLAVGPLGKLSGIFSGAAKSSVGFNNSLGSGIKKILQYGFGIRSLFVLFNKLRSAFKEGFENLAQYDSSFNTTVSNFMTACSQLKNSLASAFAPIVETILPYITKLINALNSVIDKFGQVMAALTGKTSYKKAVAVQQDYAKSVASTSSNSKTAAKSISKEAKAAKEAAKTIAGFDDVEILNENDNSSADTATPGTGTQFKDTPISGSMKNLADEIKKAWADADFTDIGRMVGEKLKDALESIPWNKIKKTLRKIAKSIATFLNGFLETPGLFTVIGKTIAEAINSAFEFVESFAANFHWASLGTAVKDGILGAVNNIDWNLIYKTAKEMGGGIGAAIESALDNQEIWTGIATTVANGLNAANYRFNAFMESINWGSIAAHIGQGLNDGMDAIDWNAMSDRLSNKVNALFDTLYNFVTTFDFNKFGSYVGNTLSTAFNDINWTEGGASVAGTINGLFEAFNGFMESTDWQSIGKGVVDAIGGFFQTFSWGDFAEVFSSVAKGIFDFLSGAIKEVDWSQVPDYIINAIVEFFTNFDWEGVSESLGELIGAAVKGAIELAGSIWDHLKEAWGDISEYFTEYINEAGGDIIQGLWNGITDALASVGTWIYDHIVKPFIDGFKEGFGIASPAKEMMPLGENVINGMLEGVLDVFADIGTWIKEHIVDPFVGGVKSLFGIGTDEPALLSVGKNLIGGLKDGLLDAMSGIGSWIGDNITGPIAGFFEEHFQIGSPSKLFAEYGEYMMEGLENGMNDSESGPQGALADIAGDLQTDFTSVDWKKLGTNLDECIKSGVDTRREFLTSAVKTLAQDTSGTFSETDWKKLGSDLVSIIKDGVNTNSGILTSAARSLGSDVFSSLNGQSWSNIGSNIIQGIGNGLSAGWSWLTNSAWNLAVDVFNSACSALGINSPSREFAWIGEMLTAGMGQGIENTQDTAVGAVTSLADAVTQEAESAHPALMIDTVTSGLDDVLSTFSDKVVDSFDSMVAAMESIASGSSFMIPAMASGTVAPYASRRAAAQNAEDSMSAITDMIARNASDRLTRDDLTDILVNVARQYLNIDFYIGDEQVARHANAGNMRIQRRYNPVAG